MDRISFVIPCFNNAENIDDLFNALFENEKQFSNIEFEYVFVDDASEDRTFAVLIKWKEKHSDKIKLLQLTKNIGSHKAVLKGLNLVTGNCVVVMAADLQDPPELSYQLFQAWKNGSKLVLAVKNNPLPLFSKLFHYLMRTLYVRNAPNGSFDYVLFDKSTLSTLQRKSIRNCNLFYRLIEIQPIFSTVVYSKQVRQKGISGWSFRKKIFFLLENILFYSISKLKLIK